MIKNPKIGQSVYFLDDNGEVFHGKITKVCSSNNAIAIDNFFHIEQKYAFSTKSGVNNYGILLIELEHLEGQIKNLNKSREKVISKIGKLING